MRNKFTVAAVLVAITIFVSGCTREQPVVQDNLEEPISVVEWCIKDVNDSEYCFTDDVEVAETAEQSLRDVDDANDEITIDIELSDFGAFITAVNGYEPDISSEFWKFTINGDDAQTGISATETKDGDKYTIELDVFDSTL